MYHRKIVQFITIIEIAFFRYKTEVCSALYLKNDKKSSRKSSPTRARKDVGKET